MTSKTAQLPGGVHAVERAADLPRQAWDALTRPSDVFLTTRWLDVVECTAGVPMTYLWVERDGVPIAGLATALATSSVPWALGRPDVVLCNSAEADLAGAAGYLAGLPAEPVSSLMPSLVAGGRHLGNTRVLYGPQATTGDLVALVEAAESRARHAGAASVAFLYLDEYDRLLADVLAARGYASYTSGRYSSLHIPSDGFDGYLASL
jgi:predicted N-acyltransferase